MRLCFMVFAMFSTIYYNIARKRDATASDDRRWTTTGGTVHSWLGGQQPVDFVT